MTREMQPTSLEAYERVKPMLPAMQQMALDAVRISPQTVWEFHEATGTHYTSASPLFTALRKNGFIRDSGVRRLTPRGARAIVWEAV